MDWLWVDDNQRLAEYCQQCFDSDYIAVDTEFVRTRTFYPIPGLVQIFDGKDIALVDPQCVTDWQPFQQLMSAESVIKVFHACGEDLELLRHCLGCEMASVFDTQLAWAMLGNEVSISFQRIVQHYTDIEIDKSATRTDWTVRPLSKKQLHYAAADVLHLYPVFPDLYQKLETKGRIDWLEQEMLWQWSTTTPVDSNKAYRNVSGVHRLDGSALNNAWYLAKWRESLCREKNLARPFVLPDSALLELAVLAVDEVPSINKARQLKPAQKRRWGDEILACLDFALANPVDVEPVKSLGRQQQKELKGLKEIVRQQAELAGIETALLCSKRDLSYLLLEKELPEKLKTWRYPIVAKPLLASLS